MSSNAAVININRSDLFKRLQINGLNVRVDALSVLEAELQHANPPYDSIDDFISQLCSVLMKISIENYLIDAEIAQKAVDLLQKERNHTDMNQATISKSVLIKNVNADKQTLCINFKSQYNKLLKSLKQLPAFEGGKFHLTSIDELNTYDSSIELKCILFALIRKDPSRIMQYLLEDPTGKVPVTFNNDVTNWREFTTFENGIYLIEGSYDGKEDIFAISSIGLPPPIANTLPDRSDNTILDDDQSDSMIIVLSDIHLDDSNTIKALKSLFLGYNSLANVPEMFVLIGNFVSKPVDQFEFKDHMKNLVKLISTCKRLANNSRFVFVPGPNDCTSTTESVNGSQFTADYFPTTTNRLKHYNLATNPFHMQINGKNLCFIGQNLTTQIIKNIINSQTKISLPSLKQNSELSDNFFTSVGRMMVSSMHLNATINRSFYSPLSLFPQVPQLILMADNQYNRYTSTSLYDCSINFSTITSFTRNEYQFVVYYVNCNQLEESQVNL